MRRRMKLALAGKVPPVPQKTIVQRFAEIFGKPPHHWMTERGMRKKIDENSAGSK